MAIPHSPITPIPNNEPDAVPSLWNTRYTEIDDNFSNLDDRATDIENEIAGSRAGNPTLGETINQIIGQIGGLQASASPASLQYAVSLDWLYRNHRIAFELFATGFRLQNHMGVAVVSGVNGDDSLDVENTSNIKVGEDYLLHDATDVTMVRVIAVLSDQRVRLAANLTKTWDASATVSGSTLIANLPLGGVDAAVGKKWISRLINLGEDLTTRAVVIRRSLNAGTVRLFFRDAYTTAWTEHPWSLRRSGGGTTEVPDGYADYEYFIPMRGDGFIRIEVEGESMHIKHIVGLGSKTGLTGYVNPAIMPVAPTISSPANAATGVVETPTLTASGYSSPAGNAFSTAHFQVATAADFATIVYDSGPVASLTKLLPAGVLAANTTYYVRARVTDVAGLVSAWSASSSFTTMAAYNYVNTPTLVSPSNGQVDIPAQPTLQSSAFAVTGGSDTHVASQWQIRLASGSWGSPLHDSGETASSKISYTVPANVLSAGQTQYVVRVRHKGTTLLWSGWSPDITFTTKQQFATILGIVLTSTGGGAGTWQRIDENFNPITTTAATFNNHPIYAGIVSQFIDDQVMVKVPKFYVKTGNVPSGTYAGKRYWLISDQAASGFVLHPAFMNSGSPIDQFWVGKYQGTDDAGSKLGSKPSVVPLTNITIATFSARASARNVGGITGFMLWSIYQLSAIQTLMLIEMGGSDSQSLIGPGNAYFVSPGALPQNVDASAVATASWRGIIGLWGNVFQFVAGLETDASLHYKIWDKNGNKTFQVTGQVAYNSPAAGGSGYAYPVSLSTESGSNYDLSLVFSCPNATDASYGNGTFADAIKGAESRVFAHGGFINLGAQAGLFCGVADLIPGYYSNAHGGRLAKV
jgi:hypothetical protein